jgi:thiamine-monophosphate kinase
VKEDQRIARVAAILGAAARAPAGSRAVEIGIGDDAAVLAAGGKMVLTIDTHVEHVHFERAWLSMQELGRKSFMAAASDLAAMGARPVGALSSLILPKDTTDDDVDEIARGQADAAQEIGAAIVGGNLSSGPFSITTTCVGEATSPLLRSGARAGDLVLVSGELGLAAAGLHMLQRGTPPSRVRDRVVEAWTRPRARIEEGLALANVATACIDVSDGFALDLHRLCEASGVGAEIDEDAVLALGGNTLADAARALGAEQRAFALFGGEDYALVAGAPREIPGFAVVGRFTESRDVVVTSARGREELPARGHSHF